MEQILERRLSATPLRARSAVRRFATALAALALLLSLPLSAAATYPGSVDGRLVIGSSVDGNFDIYTVLPNGQALQRLTTDPLFDACPSWSADGKQIAWCNGVQRGGVIDIWTMKQDGSDKRRVTDLGGRATFPDFSPDGSKILFTNGAIGASADLFVIGVDGTGLVQLTTPRCHQSRCLQARSELPPAPRVARSPFARHQARDARPVLGFGA